MKYIKLFIFLLVATLFVGCAEESLNSTSIFETTPPQRNEFDTWLKANFTDPYNIDFIYRYNDKETDNYYNVVPADVDKAKALAIMVKYVWMGAYNEVMGEDFLKSYSPRVMQLIGSCEYRESGERVLGTAEGGLKLTLFNVNAMDVDNPLLDQDSPFPNTDAVPMDLNYWYFHTMHHEFCHILTQKKNYPTDFRQVSASDYRTVDWINVADPDAPASGFVSGYASSEYNEDFAEIYSTYITHTPEAWEKILDAAKKAKLSGNDTVYVKDEEGNYVYLQDEEGNLIPETDKYGFLVPATDETGQVLYLRDDKTGSYVFYTDKDVRVPRYKGHGDPVYVPDGKGGMIIAFIYNGKFYPVTIALGDPIYQLTEEGDTVMDKNGKPVPEYYKIPMLKYRRLVDYDTAQRDKIVHKLTIMKTYFRNSWGLDLDKLRDVVLRRSKEAIKLDLKTLK